MLSNRKKREELEAQLAALQAQTAVRLVELLEKRSQSVQSQSLDAIDTRARKRKEADYPAIAFVNDDQNIDVSIVDLSMDGLKITFAKNEYVPEMLILECEPLGGLIVAETRWQDGREAGLKLDREATQSLRAAAAKKAAA